MRVFRWIAVSVLPVAAFVMAARSHTPKSDPAGDHVRRHLDSVLVELQDASTPKRMSSARRARRVELVEELAAYRNRGNFPHNYDFPGQLVPYFRDRKTGALCAVADLLSFTGRQDIVDRVAAVSNNVYVAQLASDTAFRHWLDDNGLTLAEAARIQVVYAQPVSAPQVIGTFAAALTAPIAALVSTGSIIANSTGNRDGHKTAATTLGFVTGATSLAAGVALWHSSMLPAWPGVISSSLGVASIALSAHALHEHHLIEASQRDAERRPVVTSVSLVPTLDMGDRAGSRPAVGAALSIQF